MTGVSSCGSFVNIESEALAALCRRAIAGGDARLARKRESILARWRAEAARPSWLRRLLRMAPPKVPSDDVLWSYASDHMFGEPVDYSATRWAVDSTTAIARRLFNVSGYAKSVNVAVEDLDRVRSLATWAPSDVGDEDKEAV